MRLVINLKEGLEIIEKYYKDKGYDVKEATFNLETTGKVRDMKFEIEVKDKEFYKD